jgi:hypothetical protein
MALSVEEVISTPAKELLDETEEELDERLTDYGSDHPFEKIFYIEKSGLNMPAVKLLANKYIRVGWIEIKTNDNYIVFYHDFNYAILLGDTKVISPEEALDITKRKIKV